jgi:hypothetical protein
MGMTHMQTEPALPARNDWPGNCKAEGGLVFGFNPLYLCPVCGHGSEESWPYGEAEASDGCLLFRRRLQHQFGL